jgi:hypothetical protein
MLLPFGSLQEAARRYAQRRDCLVARKDRPSG